MIMYIATCTLVIMVVVLYVAGTPEPMLYAVIIIRN